MLRVNSSNVLVVPPFECAWISEEAKQLKENAGCVTFEAKGDNDATLILKSRPGSRRWQHMQLANVDAGLGIDHHYTIIFGSHQNSCLKIEKDSQECFRVDRAASISGNDFIACWVDFNNGRITLGTGKPGSQPSYTWIDENPIACVQHVGLGSWDKHVCYRNINMHPPLPQNRPQLKQVEGARESTSEVPSLSSLCAASLAAGASPENVCAALFLVDLLAPALDEEAPGLVGYLAGNLEPTLQTDSQGFCQLPASLLAELLGNPCLECQERAAFDAVMLWAYGGRPSECEVLRQNVSDVEGLLLLIRFPLMSHTDLEGLRLHAFAQRSALLTELISEAAQDGMQQGDLSKAGEADKGGPGHPRNCASDTKSAGSVTFQRRHAPRSHNLMFVSSGDNNGVSHWLGTCYGQQEWVNPVLAGVMQVTASSPNCKHTDPRALVSGNFVRLNLAGPSKAGTWWKMDLGPHHRLICNYYTLRHDGSFDFPRAWILQGSTNGAGWVDLRRHEKDTSISLPGHCASWPVVGHAASMPYRMFRVLLKGPNASPLGNQQTLHLSLLELYGHFFQIR